MAGLPEDRRVAVGFSVTLSGQLVQAAVTLLTVQGAYVAYALASRDTKCGFEVVAGLAILVFIFSIYYSGKGVTAARNAGFEGAWNLDAGKSHFNIQALLLIVGVALLAVMIFLSGNSKNSDMTKNLADVTKKLAEMSQASSSLDSKITALTIRLEEGKAVNTQSLETLRSEVNSLRDSVTAVSESVAAKHPAKVTKGAP